MCSCKQGEISAMQNTYTQLIRKEDLNTDVCVSMMISMYFGIEMQSALQWSNEHRYTELIKAQVMIEQGKSEMLITKLYSGFLCCSKLETWQTPFPVPMWPDTFLAVFVLPKHLLSWRVFTAQALPPGHFLRA
jgi:hypothetical protein